jgi:glycosyltransferase involved in cell wall biosynthesis
MVSAIIPARNEEASIARAVESVAAQPEIGEVIVVDDQSTDGTGTILAELASRIPKLRILNTGAILPSGWTGKNYAVSIGAAAATGDWLLFTDADTYHLPGSTHRALADAAEHDAVLVSYSPEQEMQTFWERAFIPYVYCQLAKKYSYTRVNNPDLPDAAANGQFLMIRRAVYESLGGHAAVAPKILEDVALAEIVKNSGHTIYFAAPVGVVHSRMYRSFSAMWEGWTKNLYPLFGDNFDAGGAYFVVGFGLLTCVIGLFFFKASLEFTYWCSMLVVLVGWHMYYAFVLRRNHFPLGFIQYGLIGGFLFTAAHLVSWWKNTRGEVVWKGRAYPARSL